MITPIRELKNWNYDSFILSITLKESNIYYIGINYYNFIFSPCYNRFKLSILNMKFLNEIFLLLPK